MNNQISPPAPISSSPSPTPSSMKKRQLPTWVWVAVAAGVVILLLLIGLAWGYGKGNNKGAKDLYGNLPFAGQRAEPTPAPTVSGLSGRTCDDPGRRTIAVMLAGDPINRPVSGFASADMVWELPVLLNGVTRLMAAYQCGQPSDLGSVRSARHDYLFLAEGMDSILAHWGGSYHALNRIAVGEFQTINALTNPHQAFFRKTHLPAPYNGFTTYERLWNALQKLGYRTTTNFKGYEFKDDPSANERGGSGTLSIAWPGAFRVRYEYDPATNRYQRYWADIQQVDGEDNRTPVAPSAVVIMRAVNASAEGPGGYNEVQVEGEGKVEIYQDGKVILGTWKKNTLEKKDPVHFLNEQGEPIIFTRGQVWVMAVDPGISVTWQQAAATPTP